MSAETLYGVTVVCADETGTLTRNEMRVEVVDLGRGSLEAFSIRGTPEKVFDDPATLAAQPDAVRARRRARARNAG